MNRIFRVLCVLIGSAPVLADSAKTLDVPAGDLLAAIEIIAKQSEVELFYQREQLKGLKTGGVQGEYTTQDAVRKLLEGTQLRVSTDARTGAMMIVSKDDKSASFMPDRPAADEVRVALAEEETASSRNAPEYSEEKSSSSSKGIPEILVKGSRSLNMDIERTRDDALPYVTFDRQQIEKSGAQNIEEFLKKKLTASAHHVSNSQIAMTGTASSVSLRGLGSNQTLILLDGHRTSSVSKSGVAGQPDLNGIPLSSVERIEILPTTASGIYGGSATGGVINIVLKRDYSGVQTKAGYDGTFAGGASRRYADVSAGFNLEGGRTNVLLAGSYSNSSPLLNRDRDFIQSRVYQMAVNDPQGVLGASAPPLGATTNICSADPFGFNSCSHYVANTYNLGSEIPLSLKSGPSLGSAITFVPAAYAGVGSDNGAQLAANAGSYTLALADTAQAAGRRSALLNTPTVESLTATVRRDFTERVHVFLELLNSNTTGSFITSALLGRLTMPASAPGNPFNEDIIITTPMLGADAAYDSSLRHRRALAGVIVKLPAQWQGEMDFTWDRTRSTLDQPPSEALASFDQALFSGAIDVFRDTNLSAVDFSQYADPTSRAVYRPADATLKDATLRLSGPVSWQLPGGPIVLSSLIERRREDLDKSSLLASMTTLYYPSRWQTVDSAYVEARLPLISVRNTLPGLREVELTLAARYDRYETVGSNVLSDPSQAVVRETNTFKSTDPTVSVRIRPTADITLRGSYGTGFLPPAVEQVVPSVTLISAATLAAASGIGIVDPRRGNEAIGGGASVISFGGGNPDLKPEESESWSAGIVITPRVLPGLRTSVDWVRIDKKDNINTAFFFGSETYGLPSIWDYETTVPGLVTRAAPSGGFDAGPVTALNFGLSNLSSQNVEAIDFAVDYRWDTVRSGAFTLAALATRQVHNRSRILADSPLVEYVGQIGSGLPWRGNATLGWDYRQWSMAWTATYFDSYWANADHSVNARLGSATIPRQTYHDLFVRYRLDSLSSLEWLSNTELSLNIQNVFDKVPPLATTNGSSYYDYNGDPRLRRYSLGFTTSF